MSLNKRQLEDLAAFCKENKDVLNSNLNNSVTNKMKESLWLGLAQKFNAEGVDVDPQKLRKVSSLLSFYCSLKHLKVPICFLIFKS